MLATVREVFSSDPALNAKTQAALDAEVLWLCKSGMLKKIYQEEQSFNDRSLRLEKVCSWRIKRHHPNNNVTFVGHCHSHIVSLALQMWEHAWDRCPAADATISIRLMPEDFHIPFMPKKKTQKSTAKGGVPPSPLNKSAGRQPQSVAASPQTKKPPPKGRP